jgi:hypothetical protein
VVAAALALLSAAWLGRAWLAGLDLRGLLAGPEVQAREALAGLRVARLEGLAGAGAAQLDRVRLAELQVSAAGGEARALAVAEAEGTVAWSGGRAALSYVGREAIALRRCGLGRWCPSGPPLPALAGVLEVLLRRALAFDRRDPAGYALLVSDAYAGPGGKAALLSRLAQDLGREPPAALRILGWQIRVERDRAVVGEDYALGLGGAAPARLRARFVLAREGERWLIVDGL